jgi:tetratricopeptide (TPR) repeat protein
MRLFRQAQGENWDAVIARVALQLQELVKSHKARWQACEYQPHVEFSMGDARLAGVQLLLQSAFKYHLEGGLPAARSMYELVLAHNPNDLAAIRNLAALYRAQGELQLSAQTYEAGDLRGIGDCIFYTNYANLLADLGRLDAAHDKLLMALKMNPNHEPALSALKRCIELKTKDTI